MDWPTSGAVSGGSAAFGGAVSGGSAAFGGASLSRWAILEECCRCNCDPYCPYWKVLGVCIMLSILAAVFATLLPASELYHDWLAFVYLPAYGGLGFGSLMVMVYMVGRRMWNNARETVILSPGSIVPSQ